MSRAARVEGVSSGRGESSGRRLSGWGRAGAALLVLHLVLLFLPPIPPDIKGSLWSYVAGYLSAVLLAVEAGRHGAWLRDRWASIPSARGLAIALAASLVVLTLGMLQRLVSASLFERFSEEAGLFEPLTVLCYLAGAALLFETAGRVRAAAEAKHWRLLGAVYVLLAIEEVDYFGIFGGLIGRIDGVYVGSPHDLIRLAVEGVVSPAAAATAGLVLIVVPLALLWWRGYVQPRRLLRLALGRDIVLAVLGLGLIAVGTLLDAELFAARIAEPRPEELIELAGALLLSAYAIQIAAVRAARDDRPAVSSRASG